MDGSIGNSSREVDAQKERRRPNRGIRSGGGGMVVRWAVGTPMREGCNPDAAKTEELTTQSATYLSNPYSATYNYHIIRHFLTRLNPFPIE